MTAIIGQKSGILAPDIPPGLKLPDHTQLPDKDGTFVRNFQEHPQSILLTDSLWPVLQRLYPDGQFCIGQDCGIYWHITDPPLKGCKAPDWFLVPGVPPLLDGQVRRSYVLWQEIKAPLAVIEYVSGDGSEERDRTPEDGKFWVYEQGIRIPFYAIFEVEKDLVEMHHLVDGVYQALQPNARSHFVIPPLNVELGIWHGVFHNQELPWLRWWDLHGNLLLTSEESGDLQRKRAELERQRADQERVRADQERVRADQERVRADQERVRAETAAERARRLAEKLKSLGIDPDQV